MQRQADQIALPAHRDRGQRRKVDAGPRHIDHLRPDKGHAAVRGDRIGVDRAFPQPRGIEIGRPVDLHDRLRTQRARKTAAQLQRPAQRPGALQRMGLHPGLIGPGDHQMLGATNGQHLKRRRGRQGQPRGDGALIDQRHCAIDVQRQHAPARPRGGVQHDVAALHHQFHIADTRDHVQRRSRERPHHLKGIHPKSPHTPIYPRVRVAGSGYRGMSAFRHCRGVCLGFSTKPRDCGPAPCRSAQRPTPTWRVKPASRASSGS